MATPLRLPPVWLLVLLVALGPLTMTIVVPANTQVMRDFSTQYGVAQLMLTAYLLSMAVSQLFMGYLSDRFGRRPVMMAGLAAFILGCALAAIAPSLELLLFARVVQGIGGSTGQALSRATVRDVFARDKAASVLGYISMAMVVVPMVGPFFGGLLTEHASWRYIFVLLAALGVVLLALVWLRMNETAGASTAAKPRFIPSAKVLLRDRAFLGYLCNVTFAAGMFYSFLSGAPYLVIEAMQRPPWEYGLYFTITAFGYFSGNLVTGRLAARLGSDRMIRLGLWPIAVGLFLFWALSGVNHPLALFVPMALLTFSNGLVMPSALSGAMSVRPELAGTASGLNGFVQVGVGALLSFIVGFTQNGEVWPLATVLTFCGVMAAVGAWILSTVPKRQDA